MEQDRKTRAALREVHLENALAALRQAITVAGDDAEADVLTDVAQTVALRKRTATTTLADMREAEARLAHTLLDA